MSWNTVALGDICKVIAGQSPESINYNKEGKGLAFYQGKKDFGDVYINPPTVWTTEITKEAIKNDILMSVRAPVGPVNIATEHICIGRGLAAIRATDRINQAFLFNYLLKIEKELVGNAGAVFNSINKTQIENLKVPLPPIATQQKIVAKLDAIFSEIDTATAAAEANANNAEVLFQSYLETFFLNISTSSKFIKLSDVIKLEYGKGLEDSDRKVNGIYGAYGANGVKAKTNKFLYDKPSIVVGRKGSAGELTLVEDKFWALDVTYYVTHENKETDLYFLYYALKMLNIPTLAKGIKPGINRNDVYDLRIPVPTLSEQKLVVEKILFVSKNLEIAKNSYKAKCKELDFLKQSILHKAFSGELVKD